MSSESISVLPKRDQTWVNLLTGPVFLKCQGDDANLFLDGSIATAAHALDEHSIQKVSFDPTLMGSESVKCIDNLPGADSQVGASYIVANTLAHFLAINSYLLNGRTDIYTGDEVSVAKVDGKRYPVIESVVLVTSEKKTVKKLEQLMRRCC
jgi:hypothetical protein